jgi:hypothetical protein
MFIRKEGKSIRKEGTEGKKVHKEGGKEGRLIRKVHKKEDSETKGGKEASEAKGGKEGGKSPQSYRLQGGKTAASYWKEKKEGKKEEMT